MGGLNVQFQVSLDNLTVVGIPKVKASRIQQLIVGEAFVNYHWVSSNKRYHYNYVLLGGGLLQLTHDTGFVDKSKETQHQIRLEFNPNKIKLHPKLMVKYLEILKYIQEPKITRKDIAIDLLDLDLNKGYTILDYASRKRIEYKNSKMELETLYLGSKHSEVRHRIYNKAVEQGLEDTGVKWWRVECQIRKEKAEMRKYNPFTKVVIVQNSDFFDHDIKTRAMLYYLQAHPDAIKELSINSRGKYKKLLGEKVMDMFIDLEGMAEKELENIQSEIEGWINFCPIDVKEGFTISLLDSVLKLKEDEFTEVEREEMKKKMEEWEEVTFPSGGGKEEWEEWVKQFEERGENDN